MTDKKPSTAREALLAELLGDVQTILERMEAVRLAMETANTSAKETAVSIETATENYRTTINEIASRLRVETASIIHQTTEHAAKSLVGQQTSTLRQAATDAIREALSADILKRTKLDWIKCCLLAGATSAATTIGIAAVLKAFH